MMSLRYLALELTLSTLVGILSWLNTPDFSICKISVKSTSWRDRNFPEEIRRVALFGGRIVREDLGTKKNLWWEFSLGNWR